LEYWLIPYWDEENREDNRVKSKAPVKAGKE